MAEEGSEKAQKAGTKSIIDAPFHRTRTLAKTPGFPSGHAIGNGKRVRCRACWLNNALFAPANARL